MHNIVNTIMNDFSFLQFYGIIFSRFKQSIKVSRYALIVEYLIYYFLMNLLINIKINVYRMPVFFIFLNIYRNITVATSAIVGTHTIMLEKFANADRVCDDLNDCYLRNAK